MKKVKKLTTGIVASAILGSAVILASGTIINKSTSINQSIKVEDKTIDNKAANSKGVDYDARTVNGVQLYQSNELITISYDLFDIYTNFDKEADSFPTTGRTYIMVFIKPALEATYKYLEPQSPFWLYDKDIENRRYVLYTDNLTVSKDENIMFYAYTSYDPDRNSYYGPGKGFRVCYSIPKDNLEGVTITGPNSGYFGDSINLETKLTFRDKNFVPESSKVNYQWFKIVDGREERIPNQYSSSLTITMPEIADGRPLTIKCKATYDNRATIESKPFQITPKIQQQLNDNLTITSPNLKGGTYPIVLGESISLTANWGVNGGSKPPESDIEFKWYLSKNGTKILLVDQNSSTLTYQPILEDNDSIISLQMIWRGQTITSNDIRLVVTSPELTSVQITGTNSYWEDEKVSLTATPVFNPAITPATGEVTYEWTQIIDGGRTVLTSQTSSTLNVSIPKLDNSSKLSYECKVTYKNKSVSSSYNITVKKRKLTNLIISNNGSSSSSIQVKENESITLSSSYGVDHGTKPIDGITYQWYLRDKNGIEDIIPNQTGSTLNWTPSIYDTGKNILLKATWNGTTISSNTIYLVVNSNSPDAPSNPSNPNNPGGSNSNQSSEDGGIPSYVWYIIAGVVVVAVIIVIVVILMKNKKSRTTKTSCF